MSKVVVITLASIVLVGLIAAITVGFVVNSDKREDPHKMQASAKAVQSICQPTDYKEACFKSMSNVTSDDPKELVRAAFRSAEVELNNVYHNSTVLQELEKDPRTSDSVKVCRELLVDAMDDLQRSFEGLGDFESNKVISMLANIKAWLSATITYQHTCIDGFENTTTDAGQKVRKTLELALEMSSNGLAIVQDMSTLLGSIDTNSLNRRRRLLSFFGPRVAGHVPNDGIPYFLDMHPHQDRRRRPDFGPKVEGHGGRGSAGYWLYSFPYRNRRLLSFAHGDDIRLEDDEELPGWLDHDGRRFLRETNLMEDLRHMADVVVAKNGGGKYKTIEEALNGIPKKRDDNFYVIYIKEGVYNEYLVVQKMHKRVVFVGDGPTKTRITNSKNFVDGTKTYKTATVSIEGDHFMAKDIGFENTAGAEKHQAVALRVQADQSVFYNCHMDGYQDTLYVHTYRQFYRNCRVTGTIDFIFGDAAVFFQNCSFVVRKPLPNQDCIVTAQGRMERHQPTGIIIHKCRFEPNPEYYPLRDKNKAYLGRPWKEFSRTIIMESYIGDFIQPQGWLPWEGDFALDSCYYSEFNNVGPGARVDHRAKWHGVKSISYDHAVKFMPLELFENDEWIDDSGVPYDPTISDHTFEPTDYVVALAPETMASDGAPAAAPYYNLDAIFPEGEGYSSKDDDGEGMRYKTITHVHGRGKSGHKEHKGKKSNGHQHHEHEKSSHHKEKENKDKKSREKEKKGKGKEEKSGDRGNEDERKEEKSVQPGDKHEGENNKGGKPSIEESKVQHKGYKSDHGDREYGGNSSDRDGDITTDAPTPSLGHSPSPTPAPAPALALASTTSAFGPILGDDELVTLNSKLSPSLMDETIPTLDISIMRGENDPMGQVVVNDNLEKRTLMVVNGIFNDNGNKWSIVPLLDPNYNPREESKPKEPLAIHEFERILMANEEMEHETNPIVSSNFMSHLPKQPIKVDEMERMLMSDEEIYDEAAHGEENKKGMLELHTQASTESIAITPIHGISTPPSNEISPSINLAPSIAEGPNLTPSIANGPSLGPSIVERPTLAPSNENGPSPAPSTLPPPSPPKHYDNEEVQEWLPPKPTRPDGEAQAPAPGFDDKPATDELASTLPSTTNEKNLGSKFKYKYNVMLSGLVVVYILLF